MLNQLILPIEQELAKVEAIFLEKITSDIPLITQAARYVTQNGGKRIRPAIFLLASKLAGKSSYDLPYLAAAIELVHTASLLHDDVVDDAPLRRGKPSAKAKWGNQVSILVGDFLLSKASEFLIQYGNEKLLKSVTKAITSITEGEILEITRQNDITIDEKDYHRIIEGKTAVLFGVCGKGAAVINNLSVRFEEALERFGYNLGIAFQLIDDVLDYTSKNSLFGKESGTDLREGKLTLPLILSLKRCESKETHLIREALITGQITQDQFESIVSIIKRCDGLSETKNVALSFIEKAKEALFPFKPSIERDALLGIADYVIERND